MQSGGNGQMWLAPDVARVVLELQSQLAALSLEAAALRTSTGLPEGKARRALACIDRSIEIMRRVILDALDLRSIETNTLALDPTAVDLGEVITTAVERIPANDRPRITAREEPTVRVLADASRVTRAVETLLRVLLNVSGADAPIIVRLERRPDRATISLDAVGTFRVAFIEDMLRGETEPQSDWDADQLALFVARHTVAAHGGAIGLEYLTQVGLRLYIDLPTAQPT